MTNSLPTTPSVHVDLRGHDLSRLTFRRQPVLSADAILRSLVRGPGLGITRDVRAKLLTQLGDEGRAAYALLAGSGRGFCGGVVLPDIDDAQHWWLAYADALEQGDTGYLQWALLETFGSAPPGWHRVVDEPRSWLRQLGAAVRRTGPQIDQLWRHAAPLLDAEEHRLNLALEAGGAIRAFVHTAAGDLTMTDNTLHVPWIKDLDYQFAGDLVIAPQLVSNSHLYYDAADNSWLTYTLTPPSPRPEEGPLFDLLGPARAAILVALDRPTTMTELASRLSYAPSTMSHHGNKLIASGLVRVERIGRYILLRRTEIGDLLVEHLSD